MPTEAPHPQHLPFARKYGCLSEAQQVMWAHIEGVARKGCYLAEQEGQWSHLKQRSNDLLKECQTCSAHFEAWIEQSHFLRQQLRKQRDHLQTMLGAYKASIEELAGISKQLQQLKDNMASRWLWQKFGRLDDSLPMSDERDPVCPRFFCCSSQCLADGARRCTAPWTRDTAICCTGRGARNVNFGN